METGEIIQNVMEKIQTCLPAQAFACNWTLSEEKAWYRLIIQILLSYLRLIPVPKQSEDNLFSKQYSRY